MAVKGKRKARVILTLAGYAMAGLVMTLGIAWTSPNNISGMHRAATVWSAGVRTETRPEVEPILVIWFSNWRRSSYLWDRFPWLPSDGRAGERRWDWAVFAAELPHLNFEAPSDTGDLEKQDVIVGYGEAEFRGFPFRCMWAWDYNSGRNSAFAQHPGSPVDVAALAGWAPNPNWELPVTPLWPGLIVDTAIWTFAWYAMLFVPLRLLPWSAASRKRRGLCIACGYDLTGAWRRCPECGEEISMGGTKATIAK